MTKTPKTWALSKLGKTQCLNFELESFNLNHISHREDFYNRSSETSTQKLYSDIWERISMTWPIIGRKVMIFHSIWDGAHLHPPLLVGQPWTRPSPLHICRPRVRPSRDLQTGGSSNLDLIAKLCQSIFQRQIALYSPCRSSVVVVVTFCHH